MPVGPMLHCISGMMLTMKAVCSHLEFHLSVHLSLFLAGVIPGFHLELSPLRTPTFWGSAFKECSSVMCLRHQLQLMSISNCASWTWPRNEWWIGSSKYWQGSHKQRDAIPCVLERGNLEARLCLRLPWPRSNRSDRVVDLGLYGSAWGRV